MNKRASNGELADLPVPSHLPCHPASNSRKTENRQTGNVRLGSESHRDETLHYSGPQAAITHYYRINISKGNYAHQRAN